MTDAIPLIVDAHQRNMSLVYSVKGNSLSFVVARFDGASFSKPQSFSDALQSELEKKFVEIADLFEGY
jgi:hypothetical protein